eukprot:CAMPEP_0183456992 /NCGR_PEP_ID=MMETSP0370-20130417/130291_1 /TAXON_ID=268820 /ORGANISM="Peridinium aciculiferum, Strain PAER-2" /LENGTH=126 /DNA_ID=CAMNT_0025648679 /DNA_START=15 /DNA_END=392 /DNA_ORIENTATION=-
MAELCKVRIRAAGSPDFDIELEPTATVLDAKIAATAGCDIDPQFMIIICKGRVLKDEEVLSNCSVRSGDALHVARGSPLAVAAPAAAAASSSGPTSGPTIGITVKGPGGVDVELQALGANEPVERL